ncbi:DNA polymerase III subunit gamma and tau [uncultured Corynebacterium sp.]|uniref:DNA polymerase III subunit gamma and tau n=1 Tax=uncultured Corynebacterium sp. TaxID=159447 RepID=UPI0025EC68D1|nr:DNA polymerase III subunit gamma and tau [uncultured Corynebacterium sp.]
MALYRKYRPASFDEVVGQEHVTGPLSVALDSGRINHAYLFSGPRGCGKTSSARILARSLNCAQGPTSTPCGVCNSCVSLAPGGPGNLDVTELDAASHNGVEDMRELRDRAFYAPAESRYRVFIIDEAHMITNAGSNALLKIVEEPPAHLIFIFATTEPEKVIGTIRSRTHHYPFRLLTPTAMRGLLERTCQAEGVHVDDAVYPLVIRAGGGSPRDSLSILDQLLAGAGAEGLSYERSLPLLGVTDSTLIDDAIISLSTKDKARMFTTIDHVIEAGHDPRRFTTDLLDRLRDLMILQAVPEALNLGLVDAPVDRSDTLIEQAGMFNGNELASLAGMVNTGLDDMRGATSPRLLLEILCARLLLSAGQVIHGIPAAPAATGGVTTQAPTGSTSYSAAGGAAAAARAKALAASQSYGQRGEPKKAEPAPPSPPASQTTPEPPAVSAEPVAAPPAQAAPSAPTPQADWTPQPTQPAPEPAPESAPASPPAAPAQPTPAPEAVAEPRPTPVPAEDLVSTIRNGWANLRALVGKKNIRTEIMLTEAKVLGIRQNTLVLGHSTGALANRLNAPDHNEVLVSVLLEELGATLAVECIVGTDPAAAGFTAQTQTEKPTWNPTKPAVQEPPAQQQMPEPAQAPVQPVQQTQQAPAQQAVPAPQAVETDDSEEPESPAPAQNNGGWGNPVRIGSEAPAATPSAPVVPEPAPVPAPPQPARPEANSKLSWRERAEQAAANASAHRQAQQGTSAPFQGGVPLPPEPEDLPPMPDDPYGYPADEGIPQRNQQASVASQTVQAAPSAPTGQQAPSGERGVGRWSSKSEEEEMIREAANEPGQMDRRDAKTIAMELLAEELGAQPL